MAFKCKIKEKEYKKMWATKNKASVRLSSNKWKKQNREDIREYENTYRLHNKDIINLRRRTKGLTNKAGANAREAKRKAAKLKRTPAWLNKDDFKTIRQFYTEAHRLTKETGIIHHVDHIIPLQGKTVSGLHVPSNLQILTAHDNVKKSNKY